MKKITLLLILLLFSITRVNAGTSFYFNNGKEGITKITTRTWNEFDIYLSYNNSEDFEVNFILAKLEYDNNKLELIKITGLNSFTATYDKLVLFDRMSVPKKDNKKVAKITFKTKKSGTTIVKFKDISVANFEQELSAEDISIEVKSKVNVARISLIIGIISVIALLIYMFYPKIIKFIIKKKK